MLAMVFVYLLRAKVVVFCPRDFFLALHIAHDMEDDYYVCQQMSSCNLSVQHALTSSWPAWPHAATAGWPGRDS
jgi:hypothetical protein